MARLIFKCPYLKPGSTVQRKNYVKYIATRIGAEKTSDARGLLPVSATERQQKLIASILRDVPGAADSFEYEDYIDNPTCLSASEFITAAIEQNFAAFGKRQNYLDYIAKRPGAEYVGAHGLFTDTDAPIVLPKIAEEAANHEGNLWLPVISLRREDAERLGYDNAAAWKATLSAYAADMARGLKIAPERFRWYAAFHDKDKHPHVHMVCWSENVREGFLTKDGIRQIKSGLAGRVFRQELLHVYDRQTEYRKQLGEQAQTRMAELIADMENGELHNERIETLTVELATRLQSYKGKKVYGYLPVSLKKIVDAIADELCGDPRVAECYKLWCDMRMEVLRTYMKNPPHPGKLSEQSELKRIRNIIIEEAALNAKDTNDPPPNHEQNNTGKAAAQQPSHQPHPSYKPHTATMASRLMHHLSRIFEANPPIPVPGSITDRRLRRKIREKKQAQGHAHDDHEQQMLY
jgi:hypothetical protein